MRVRHAAKSKGPSKSAPTPPHIGSEVDLDTPMPTVSTVTKSLSGGTSATTLVSDKFVPPPPQEATRLSSVANLKRINNTKKLKAHQKAALKRVTQLYSVQLEKAADDSPKKSAEKIEEIVKKQFDGVGPSAHSIQSSMAGSTSIQDDKGREGIEVERDLCRWSRAAGGRGMDNG